jgi:hypothetical protein
MPRKDGSGVVLRNATITTAVMAKHVAPRPSRAASAVLRSVQLVFIRTVGMVTFAWIASAFYASQRREWSGLVQRHNHHRRHGEARSDAAIQGSAGSTAERSADIRQDGGHGYV